MKELNQNYILKKKHLLYVQQSSTACENWVSASPLVLRDASFGFRPRFDFFAGDMSSSLVVPFAACSLVRFPQKPEPFVEIAFIESIVRKLK